MNNGTTVCTRTCSEYITVTKKVHKEIEIRGRPKRKHTAPHVPESHRK